MGKPKKRSQAFINMAVEMYNSGINGNMIAKKLGVSPPTVYMMLEEGGVKVAGRYESNPLRYLVKGEDAENVINDYKEGIKWKDLKEKYGFNVPSMKEAIRRAGIPLRDHGGQRRRIYEHEVDEIIRLFQSGVNQTAIAYKLKCQQTVVSRILIQKGLFSSGKNNGENHGSWKGGIAKNGEGYLLQKVYYDDPYFSMAARSGYIPQHRYVMAKHLGRVLSKNESVHHIDGDRANNNIENLQIRFGKHGKGVVLKCACCGSNNIIEAKLNY